MPPAKVTWSYTYTRPGYTRKSAPAKDWWTEDISELDVEVFRSVISTVRASCQLPPPLIGEALHAYQAECGGPGGVRVRRLLALSSFPDMHIDI